MTLHKNSWTPLLIALLALPGLSGTPTTAQAESVLGEKTDRALEQNQDFLSDSALTAKVKTALIAETGLESMKIEVESQDGVVILSGEVPDLASVTLARHVVEQVDGVREVHSRLSPRAPS